MGPLPYYALAYLVLLYGSLLAAFAAWVTHIVVCFRAASYLLLTAGAIMPPIGVIHGWCIWLGVV